MEIRVAHVQRSLETLGSRFNAILEPSSSGVLLQAKSMLLQSKARFDARQGQQSAGQAIRRWGYIIGPDNPLRFREVEIDGFRLRIDMFLRSYWEEHPAEKPSDLTVAVRVWCLTERMYFRPEWDAPELEGQIDPEYGRVMLRVHFDLANSGQSGPVYHLQFGGVQHPGELNWFPEALSLPRLLHTPVDLVLATEMIAATFYPLQYKALRREPLWKNCMRVSQNHLLRKYLEQATKAVDSGDSLLEAVWNKDLG